MRVVSYFRVFALHVLIMGVNVAWANIKHHGPICAPEFTFPDATDTDKIQFLLNLEFLDAAIYLCGATGQGLDAVDPSLSSGGPQPIGCQKANLDPLFRKIFHELGLQQAGHIRAIMDSVGGFPRPLLDISSESYARLFDQIFGYKLDPPFDPYANSINFLIAAYTTPYYSVVGYVATIPILKLESSRRLAAKLLGVRSGQDAIIRTLLYERQKQKVHPYGITVAEFTNRISALSNKLAMCGIKDEGLRVPLELGAENRTTSNILSADAYSLSYERNYAEILKTVYGTGDASCPGGFYPRGANGNIARMFLDQHGLHY